MNLCWWVQVKTITSLSLLNIEMYLKRCCQWHTQFHVHKGMTLKGVLISVPIFILRGSSLAILCLPKDWSILNILQWLSVCYWFLKLSSVSPKTFKKKGLICVGASLVAQMVKNLPAVQETWVWYLGREDPLEKGMATHCSALAWRIPWTEEPGGLQSMGSQRVGQTEWLTHIICAHLGKGKVNYAHLHQISTCEHFPLNSGAGPRSLRFTEIHTRQAQRQEGTKLLLQA